MRRFFLGLAFGLIVGMSSAAFAAKMIGGGDLLGWVVKVKGKEVCSDPFVYSLYHEIECD
jgi:hypothetical protein